MLYLFVNWATSVSNDVTCYICSLIYMLSSRSHCTTIIQQPYITSGKLLRNPNQAWWEQASREMLSAVGATQTVLNRTEWNRHGVLTYICCLHSRCSGPGYLQETCGHFALSFLSAVCSARPSSLMQYVQKKKIKKNGPVSRSHLRHSIFSLIRLEVTAVLSWRKGSTQPILKKWQPAGYFKLDWLVLFVARLIEKQFTVILLLGWGWLVIVRDWSACWLYKGDGMEMACTHFQHQSSHSFHWRRYCDAGWPGCSTAIHL